MKQGSIKQGSYVGREFGRLKVISDIPKQRPLRRCFLLRCVCGALKVAVSSRVINGHVTSCGCRKAEINCAIVKSTHGKRYSRAYGCWGGIKKRCYNPKCNDYPNYGGRGIKVCDRWLNSFENFYEDMGDPPKGLTLERKNNNGDYDPDNCIWADRHTQARNRRPSSEWKSNRSNSKGENNHGTL